MFATVKSARRKLYARMQLFGLIFFIAAGAVAQPTEPLPSKLSGQWTGMARYVITDKVSLTIDGDRQPGPVTGRVSFRGFECGAQDEPFQGTWDGTELRLETTHRANVNTQRMGGGCENGRATYTLRRKPGESVFNGEIRLGFSPIVLEISVSP